MKKRIEVNGTFLGYVEPYFKPLSYGRGISKRPAYFAYRQDGQRTGFTLPSRKQAIEWLKEAAR